MPCASRTALGSKTHTPPAAQQTAAQRSAAQRSTAEHSQHRTAEHSAAQLTQLALGRLHAGRQRRLDVLRYLLSQAKPLAQLGLDHPHLRRKACKQRSIRKRWRGERHVTHARGQTTACVTCADRRAWGPACTCKPRHPQRTCLVACSGPCCSAFCAHTGVQSTANVSQTGHYNGALRAVQLCPREPKGRQPPLQ